VDEWLRDGLLDVYGDSCELGDCLYSGTEPCNMYESDGDSEAERDGLGPYNVLLDSSF